MFVAVGEEVNDRVVKFVEDLNKKANGDEELCKKFVLFKKQWMDGIHKEYCKKENKEVEGFPFEMSLRVDNVLLSARGSQKLDKNGEVKIPSCVKFVRVKCESGILLSMKRVSGKVEWKQLLVYTKKKKINFGSKYKGTTTNKRLIEFLDISQNVVAQTVNGCLMLAKSNLRYHLDYKDDTGKSCTLRGRALFEHIRSCLKVTHKLTMLPSVTRLCKKEFKMRKFNYHPNPAVVIVVTPTEQQIVGKKRRRAVVDDEEEEMQRILQIQQQRERQHSVPFKKRKIEVLCRT